MTTMATIRSRGLEEHVPYKITGDALERYLRSSGKGSRSSDDDDGDNEVKRSKRSAFLTKLHVTRSKGLTALHANKTGKLARGGERGGAYHFPFMLWSVPAWTILVSLHLYNYIPRDVVPRIRDIRQG
jgi:hypothetical protein